MTRTKLVAAGLAWVHEHRVDVHGQSAGRRPAAALGAATDLLTTGVLDSLGFVRLFAFLQEQTGRVVDLSEFDPDVFSTLEGLCGAFCTPEGGACEH